VQNVISHLDDLAGESELRDLLVELGGELVDSDLLLRPLTSIHQIAHPSTFHTSPSLPSSPPPSIINHRPQQTHSQTDLSLIDDEGSTGRDFPEICEKFATFSRIITWECSNRFFFPFLIFICLLFVVVVDCCCRLRLFLVGVCGINGELGIADWSIRGV